MKYYSKFAFITIAIFFIFFSCNAPQSEQNMPAPINTIVNINNEEGEENTMDRELWMERMHRTAPGKNWRNIERKNSASKIQNGYASRSSETVKLGGDLYSGKWSEKGSNNQAGSVVAINYDKVNDDIYTISAGGTLWKGKRDGSSWEVINQSYRFDDKTLFFLNMANGKIRMIATIARIPHYSDDLGLTWSKSTGLSSSGDFWSFTRSFESINYQGSTRIYCLAKNDYWSNIFLYYSDDNGETYEQLYDTRLEDLRQVCLVKPNHSNQLLLAKNHNAVNSALSIFELQAETNTVELVIKTDLKTSLSSRMILLADFTAQDTLLYALDENLNLNSSKDMGRSWQFLANSSVDPWDVGCFMSPSDRDQVFLGAVEAFRLENNSFQKLNDWWAYYNNVASAIHADIMSFEEFESPDGRIFQLIGNHGGMSISYDYLKSLENIGMEGLNVAQYYDVRTDPINPDIVYAGSQDQGFQRAENINVDGSVDFQQVISGDYGHITFSNNGQGMWIGYPGGNITYYSDPHNGYQVAEYTIDSPDESSWLTPMTEIPGSKNNEILVAGGNSNTGESGSYIIKLAYDNGISAEQLPFNFSSSSGGELSAITASPLNSNLIYASTNNGIFYYSQDGGQSFEIGFNAVNNGHYLYGASIYASRINENEVWIAGSGYNNDGIFYSDDYGESFSLFTEGLPSTLVFEITANADETQFFAATEAGPYVYLKETGKWEDLSQGNVPVNTYWSVEYLEASKTVRFGTYGRGIFDFVFLDALSDSDNDGVADIDDICPGFDDNIDTDEDGIPDGCDLCDDTNPLKFDLVVNNPIICTKEGIIDLDISGGAPPYIFENNGSPITLPFESNIEGSYDFSIRDANNCKLDTSIFLLDNSYALEVGDPQTVVKCADDEDFTIQVNTGDYEILWANGITSNEIANASEGVYTYTLTDEFGCVGTSSITVIEGEVLTINLDLVDAVNGQGGSAVASVSSTSATLTWSTGETGAEISNLGPGAYSVTATDENGCMLIENFTIENESSTSVDASPILNFDMSPNPAKDFLLVSLSTAGALPYEFKIVDMLGREVWSTRDTKSTSSFTVDLSNIEAGTYFCIVKSGSSTKSEKLIVVK